MVRVRFPARAFTKPCDSGRSVQLLCDSVAASENGVTALLFQAVVRARVTAPSHIGEERGTLQAVSELPVRALRVRPTKDRLTRARKPRVD